MITLLHRSINIACQQVTGINLVIYFHIPAFPIPAPAFPIPAPAFPIPAPAFPIPAPAFPIPAPAFPYTAEFFYFHEANNSVQAPGE
jgi:hypothetical protein